MSPRHLALLATLSIITLSGSAFAKPIVLPTTRPLVVLTDEQGKPEPVRLAHVEMNVDVRGDISQTTLVLTFANDQARVLGGQLEFPLPEGATVSG